MRLHPVALPAVLLVGAVALSNVSFTRAEAPPAKNFALQDAAGKNWSLHDQKAKVVVVAFLALECPMSNGYLPTLADLSRKYADKGVTLVGVLPDPDTTDKQLAAHAREYATPFPLLRDPEQKAVAALGAKVTPEVVVLDDHFLVRYRGRIDDQYSARLKPRSTVTQHNLVDAIEELLAGNDVRVAETRAFGCPIASTEPKPKAGSMALTFYKDIVPILQKHCQGCHRPGQAGPFELTSFKSTVKWADLCLEEVKSRRMPPWKPAENPLLADARNMPAEAIRTLEQWVAQGMAEGDPKDAPPAVAFNDDWTFGKPDLILESVEETTVAASGPDLFQVQVFPTHFNEDKYIVAMEVRPGNARVVHHTVQFIDTSGVARKTLADYQAKQPADAPDHGPGYSIKMGLGFLPSPNAFLGGWAPGMLPKLLPDGVGQRLPRDADICVQFHFHRTGKRETDRTRIGVYFAKKPVAESFYMLPPNGVFWKIPAGAKDYKVNSVWRLTDDVTVHRLVPHMHLIGKDIELLITPPGEGERSLIRIPEWDYNWQEQYDLKEPLHLRAGTLLRVRATYDNSADNPMNPSSPPRDVMLGEQTTSEMCFVFMGISTTRLLPPILAPMKLW
jgi:peroxiredoxin